MKSLHSNTLRLWLLPILISVMAVAAMGYKWLSLYRSYGMDTNVIRSQSQLENFLLHHQNTIECTGGQ